MNELTPMAAPGSTKREWEAKEERNGGGKEEAGKASVAGGSGKGGSGTSCIAKDALSAEDLDGERVPPLPFASLS